MNVLITGGAGFIGSAFARLLARERPDWTLVVYDKLSYAGNLQNLAEIAGRYQFVRGDIVDEEHVAWVLDHFAIATVVNFAAESHVDRSILSGRDFAMTDVVGTHTLIEQSRKHGVSRFLQVSTDEVYGSIPSGHWTEESPLLPNSPYSASKAGGDLQVRAAFRTYGFPALITRGSNTYGPYQYPEKIIPLFITHLLEGRKVPLYGDGSDRRDWLHVDDHARGILTVLERGVLGEVYNLGSTSELSNFELTRGILSGFGKDETWIEPHPERAGHDRRYALNSAKAEALGWKAMISFDVGLTETIAWYRTHEEWWKTVKNSERFRDYYRRQYDDRNAVGAVLPPETIVQEKARVPVGFVNNSM